MKTKPAKFIFNGAEIEIGIGSSIKRDELYGKKIKQIEKDGEILQKGVLTQNGELYPAGAFGTVRVDESGSLTGKTQAIGDDGSQLPVFTSSFKEAREIKPITPADGAELCVESVMPVETGLDQGWYETKFTYRDGNKLQDAVLVVKGAESFLLTGEKKKTPMLGKGEVYEFFDGDDDLADKEEDENIDFNMF